MQGAEVVGCLVHARNDLATALRLNLLSLERASLRS
jgi:hypothetical protein